MRPVVRGVEEKSLVLAVYINRQKVIYGSGWGSYCSTLSLELRLKINTKSNL